MRTYTETFDDGPGGWLAWHSNAAGARALEVAGGCAIDRAPWWVDYNHAPPGAGYLHVLHWLPTTAQAAARIEPAELRTANRFVAGGFTTDFTGARLTVTLRGPIQLRGAQLVLLVQGYHHGVAVNHLLTGQPFPVGARLATQTVVLEPDPEQWVCLGSRHDRTDFYGQAPIGEVLRKVDIDIIFALFPLDVVPARPTPTPHRLRAGEDYPLQQRRLPSGALTVDDITIEFAH